MTTEDEEINAQNTLMLTDEIFARLTAQGVKTEKIQIREFLAELKR